MAAANPASDEHPGNGDSEDEIDRVSSTYGVNYARLAALKTKYDPGNLFRLNQNVQPSAQRPAA